MSASSAAENSAVASTVIGISAACALCGACSAPTAPATSAACAIPTAGSAAAGASPDAASTSARRRVARQLLDQRVEFAQLRRLIGLGHRLAHHLLYQPLERGGLGPPGLQ